MSCNFYIHTKDADLAFDLLPRVEMVKEQKEFVVHLAQTAIGWKNHVLSNMTCSVPLLS